MSRSKPWNACGSGPEERAAARLSVSVAVGGERAGWCRRPETLEGVMLGLRASYARQRRLEEIQKTELDLPPLSSHPPHRRQLDPSVHRGIRLLALEQ